MTTPTSALGLSHIQTEFGGSNPIAISEYYGVNANVPASGTIAMSKFLGISNAPVVTLPANTAIAATDTYPATSNAYMRFTSAGGYQGSGFASGTWLTSGSASQVDIKIYYSSGTHNPSGDSVNAWLNLGTSRQWQLLNPTDQTIRTSTMILTLRDANSLANLITRIVTFYSENEK
jgi:hypothetical protein